MGRLVQDNSETLCFSFRKITAPFLIFSVLFILAIGFFKTLFFNHKHKTFSLKTIHEMLCQRWQNWLILPSKGTFRVIWSPLPLSGVLAGGKPFARFWGENLLTLPQTACWALKRILQQGEATAAVFSHLSSQTDHFQSLLDLSAFWVSTSLDTHISSSLGMNRTVWDNGKKCDFAVRQTGFKS